MTNFIKMPPIGEGKKETQKPTVFKTLVGKTGSKLKAVTTPFDYKNVMHIGRDKTYGDVFKAWDDEPNNFIIYFGEAGDEFQ